VKSADHTFTATFEQSDGKAWRSRSAAALHAGKQPGVQGPIDDAFSQPFLCVIGTGTPWNPGVHAWAAECLKRFQYEWSRYFRGELRIKKDTEVTPADLRNYNLILFGDPGSNVYIARVLKQSRGGGNRFSWNRKAIYAGTQQWSAEEHVLQEVLPSPFAAGHRYVVINSGHTFHEAELARLNYLLYPHLGDYAVIRIAKSGAPGSVPTDKTIVTGYFNEDWSLPQQLAAAVAVDPQ
jgi:hypothetical protein